MTDLETRVRTALQSDPGSPPVEEMVRAVRRNVRRRRARRTTLLAAAAVVATVAGGVLAHRSTIGDAANRTNQDGRVGTTAVAVTGSGQVFKIVSGVGCPQLCSTVWRQDGSHWTRLAEFHGNEDAPLGTVIWSLVMAPDGRDGWAWGKALYATHDGGRTWSEVTAVPYQPFTQIDVEVGPREVWVTSQEHASSSGKGSTLWHAAVGSDDWAQVRPPVVLTGAGVHSTATDWDIEAVLPDGRVAMRAGLYPRHEWYYVGDQHGWSRQPVRCTSIPPLLGGRVQDHRICGPLGRYTGRAGAYPPLRYSEVQVGVHPGTASAPVGDADILYASPGRAVVATPSGVVRSDLRLGADYQVVDSSQAGHHVVILTRGGRVFLSNDNGLHWTQQK